MKKPILKIMAIAALLAIPAVQASAIKEPVTVAAAEGAAKQPAKKYYVTAGVLNVRSGPGTDYSLVGSLTRGMEVKVISMIGAGKGKKGKRWAKIRFQGVTAYVSANHIAKR